MAGDGSAALGAPEIAGVMVSARGYTKKLAMGGMIYASVSSKRAAAKAQELPSFGRSGYLAASESDVALIKTKSGALKMKVTEEALASVPREELESVALAPGKLISVLKLQFTNGTVWEFDVPKVSTKSAKAFVTSLGGTID
jgi:hypothetical protein